MSAPEVTFDAPAPDAKRSAKRSTRRRKAATPRNPEPFPGLTKIACASACGEKGCVISGKSYCAHPTKGGLQAADLTNHAAMRRLQNARNQLGVKIDPDRFTRPT